MAMMRRSALLFCVLCACQDLAEAPPETPVPADDMRGPPAEEPPPPRVAVINEIHYAPADRTVREEFIEVASIAPAPVDLSGWRITGGVAYTFPAGTTLAPGAYLVVAQDPAVLAARFGGVSALGPFQGGLSSKGEDLVLRDAAGRRRDEVAYGRGFPWPTGGGEGGLSIERIHPLLDGRRGGSWRLSADPTAEPQQGAPTPGARNAAYDENAPPLIDEVAHHPLAPRGGEAVTVTAALDDSDGVREVTLEVQVVEPGAYVRRTDPAYAQGWVALPMRDDGTAGDARRGDGVFTAVVDGGVAAHRRLVRYRVTATDGKGRAVRVPYPDDPQPNFAWFVYDGVPAWRGASQPGVTPDLEFGADVVERLPVYHLIAQESDVIKSQYERAYESAHFLGTLVEGGVVYDHITFENRGEYSTYVSGKNKWRLHFHRGHEFQARDDFGRPYRARWRTMNLSACASPWVPPNRGMACLDESVAHRIYELAGVPAPRMHALQLRVIDEAAEASPGDQYRGDLWGLYGAIEQTDGAFLEERDLPDGNVYKIENAQGDKRHQGPLPPTTAADYDAYRAGFNAAQPISWWRDNVDLPGYYAFRAVDAIVNNMDLRDGWNHCQYHNPQTGRWTAIPWDLDMLYMPVTHWPGVLNIQNAILQHPALHSEYRDRARELQDLLLVEDQLGAMIDEQAAFAGAPAMSGGLTVAQLDEAMWNHHPRAAAAHRGAFYLNPASVKFRGGTVTRVLDTADHAGMARWIKDFTLTGYGAARLDAEIADPEIPDRPTITYGGEPGFPLDGIVLRSGPFSDPQGEDTFDAMRWRVAEVTPATAPPDRRTPRRYEIQAAWESPILASFNDTIRVPAWALRVGAVHRARVRMRDQSGRWSRWSEPLEFTVAAPASPLPQQGALRVTEIHYHPAGDLHEEFIEVMNIGDAPVDLSAVAFTGGIRFRFAEGAVKSLAPGARVVVVEDLDDFRARYGEGPPVAGQYRERLANGGERLVLAYGQDVIIQDFSYKDGWHPRTDGGGPSLEVVDPRGGPERWGQGSGWRESATPGGTPGR